VLVDSRPLLYRLGCAGLELFGIISFVFISMSYAIGLAPIVLPLLFTPTLDEMQGRELQRDYVLPLDWQFVRKNMVYSKKNVDDGRWWTHVTYAFVHKDLEHVYNNFAMLLPSAISVQSEYGIFGLWLTFFGGCCLGTRNIGRGTFSLALFVILVLKCSFLCSERDTA